jgi:hypothetical protein
MKERVNSFSRLGGVLAAYKGRGVGSAADNRAVSGGRATSGADKAVNDDKDRKARFRVIQRLILKFMVFWLTPFSAGCRCETPRRVG